MELMCTVQFPGDVALEIRDFFVAHGWKKTEEGSFAYGLHADLTGVDGPSIRLHTKIQELYASSEITDDLPVSVLITLDGRELFKESATFGRTQAGGHGMRISATDPPFFDDLLRLRDKVLATLVAIGRGQ